MPPEKGGALAELLLKAVHRLHLDSCSRRLIKTASLKLAPEAAVLVGGWQGLPEDVFLLVLACFGSRGEAAAARRVCRAWRDMFDSSTRCITIHSNPGLLPLHSSSWPNLAQLVVSHTSSSAAQSAVGLLALPCAGVLVHLELSHSNLQQGLPDDLHLLTGLRSLVVSNSHLRSLKGSQLHLLPRLEHLDLSYNELGELPSCIGSLGTLHKLNVSDNRLAYLPEGLGGLTQLHTLRASNNVLLELPDSLMLPTLTRLDFSYNRLKALPEGLSKLSGLQLLSLFAAFSHTPRNEDAPAVRVLAGLVLAAGEGLHLQAEDVVMALVRLRRRRLQQAAARAAALEEPLPAADDAEGL